MGTLDISALAKALLVTVIIVASGYVGYRFAEPEEPKSIEQYLIDKEIPEGWGLANNTHIVWVDSGKVKSLEWQVKASADETTER